MRTSTCHFIVVAALGLDHRTESEAHEIVENAPFVRGCHIALDLAGVKP